MVTLAADIGSGLIANVTVSNIAHKASVIVRYNRVEVWYALDAGIVITACQARRKTVELNDSIGDTGIINVDCVSTVADHTKVSAVAGHAVSDIAANTSSNSSVTILQGSKSYSAISTYVVR